MRRREAHDREHRLSMTRRLCQFRVQIQHLLADLVIPVPCSIGLSATTIASSFGKVISGEPQRKSMTDTSAELLRYLLGHTLLHHHITIQVCRDATPCQCHAEDKDLNDYKPADLAMALCRMVSYNIAQLAYLNAKKEGINRIFFGGKYDLMTNCTASKSVITPRGVLHHYIATCRLLHSRASRDHGDYQLCHRILVKGEHNQACKAAMPCEFASKAR